MKEKICKDCGGPITGMYIWSIARNGYQHSFAGDCVVKLRETVAYLRFKLSDEQAVRQVNEAAQAGKIMELQREIERLRDINQSNAKVRQYLVDELEKK